VAAVAPVPGPRAELRSVAPARAARARLRVAVVADSAAQPRWLIEALARVAGTDFSDIVLVAVNSDCVPGFSGQNPGRSRNSPLLFRAYAKLDRKLFGRGSDWTQPQDMRLLAAANRRAQNVSIDALRELNLDVIVAVGDVDERELDGIARYGTWRFCFGGDHATRAPLAGMRELLHDEPVLASGLRIRRGAGQDDRVAHASWSRAFSFSLARGHDGLFPKTAQFLARALRELHASGSHWFDHATTPANAPVEHDLPGGLGLARDLVRVGGRVAQRAVEHFTTVGQWTLAYRFTQQESWTGTLDGFHHLVPPTDRFWADPFPLERDGRHYIFFEELPFAAGRAHISVIEVKADGTVSEPKRVLERDYHLSYPFLFEDQGELYMIPETAHNRAVELYRCVSFPDQWKFERTLVKDAWAADATIHRANDRLWMFATVGFEGGEINDELHLFSADRLTGPWKAHRRNPIRSDVRGARPAGRLFVENGELMRPGQICTPLYGSGIALHRVTRLDDLQYSEEEVRRIAPQSAGVLGLHTINRAGALSVTDAFVRRRRFRA
jgi:hypothetical protein